MKKVSEIVLTCLLITITLSTIHFISKKDSKILEDEKKEESSFLTYMLETDVGSNKFETKTNINLPLEGYHINILESGCENGGTLSWNSEKEKIEASLLTSDKCYVYLDNVQVKSEFEYTGNYEEYIVPSTGTYKIELWGASGGNINSFMGGKGAYIFGNIDLEKGEKIYIYVGEAGKGPDVEFNYNPNFNGGAGIGLRYAEYGNYSIFGGSGGGATDVRITKGEWDNFDSLKSRIIVAAGGGGACNRGDNIGDGNGGAGGTLNGINGQSINNSGTEYRYAIAYGATQTSAGISYWVRGTYPLSDNFDPNLIVGGFGYAGIIWGRDCDIASCQPRNNTTWGVWGNQSGGGGGYYGGASSLHAGAAGGSSFISGYPGCDAIDEKSTQNNIIHTGEPIHYSGKVFTDSKMIAGNETMPSPDGGTEEGHTGNGYAKITLVK